MLGFRKFKGISKKAYERAYKPVVYKKCKGCSDKAIRLFLAPANLMYFANVHNIVWLTEQTNVHNIVWLIEQKIYIFVEIYTNFLQCALLHVPYCSLEFF